MEFVALRLWKFLLLASLPAAVLSFLVQSAIETYLFNPWTASSSFSSAVFAFLVIERMETRVLYTAIEDVPTVRIMGIGLCQATAMLPGVSRSGATIMGGSIPNFIERRRLRLAYFSPFQQC